MRHYDTSCGPMSCIPTRKDGVPEFSHQTPILSCSGVAIPLVKLQVITLVAEDGLGMLMCCAISPCFTQLQTILCYQCNEKH